MGSVAIRSPNLGVYISTQLSSLSVFGIFSGRSHSGLPVQPVPNPMLIVWTSGSTRVNFH